MAIKMNDGMQIKRTGPKYNEKGEEMMDPTPVALPIAFKRPESVGQMMQRLIKNHYSKVAAAEGLDSFDDADDFDIGDDVEPKSPYESDLDGTDALPAVNEPRHNTHNWRGKRKAALEAAEKRIKELEAERDAHKSTGKGHSRHDHHHHDTGIPPPTQETEDRADREDIDERHDKERRDMLETMNVRHDRERRARRSR